MNINYIKSESSIKPELVDTASSKKYTYLRKDIIETQKVDEISNETISYYEYQEAKLTKAEYQEYLAELTIIDIQQQRADIDYIAIMTGVDLEV